MRAETIQRVPNAPKMMIAALKDVAKVFETETDSADKHRQRDAEAAARHPDGGGGSSKRLKMIIKPGWEPATRKTITDMMERAVKAGFYQQMPDERSSMAGHDSTGHAEHRDSVLDLTFPRHTLVSLLVFVVCWELLSYLAPVLGIPAVRHPELRQDREKPRDHHVRGRRGDAGARHRRVAGVVRARSRAAPWRCIARHRWKSICTR